MHFGIWGIFFTFMVGGIAALITGYRPGWWLIIGGVAWVCLFYGGRWLHNKMSIRYRFPIIFDQRLSSNSESSGSVVTIAQMVSESGLSAIYPSREYYARYRPNAPSVDRYIESVQKSLTMVSVNLMTGVSYDDVCAVIGEKLELRDNPISCTISLLDPRRDDLMSSIAPVFSRTPKNLSDSILNTIHDLFEFQKTLSPAAQERLHIRVHATIPSGSAILIDHGEPFGRIQIETKPYGAPLRDSFAFEVMKTEARGLYDTLVLGYTNLIADGDAVRPELFLFTRIVSQDEHTFDASDIT